MDKNRQNNSDKPHKVSVLKHAFDRHAMISISDEQIRRLLIPIFKMIHEGRFHRRRAFTGWLQKLVVLAIAIMSVILLVAFI